MARDARPKNVTSKRIVRSSSQDFSKFRITRLPPVTFNFGARCSSPNGPRRADACARFVVHWEVTHKSPPDTGKREITDGTDYVTAVLRKQPVVPVS